MNEKPLVIAIEEHYFDKEVVTHYGPEEARPQLRHRLEDLTDARIREMDEAGIDVQVLSHAAPGTHLMDAAQAVPLARGANDRLHEAIRANPQRLSGFATLPAADPKAAADELERCVTRLGLKGAMVHGLTQGRFIDDKRFWPIFERAQALDVPIYVHPAKPHPTVIDVYYGDYVEDFPQITNAAWGFTVETATQGVRLVLSGVFERYPGLKIILGHLGEGLPFLLWRIDAMFSRKGNKSVAFRETFCKHFWITTSGNFSDPAMLCSLQEMGADRILFAVDWPYVENRPGTAWMERIALSKDDKAKILSGNAQRLLKL